MKNPFPSDREVVVSRVLDAPRTRVFAAWTAPEVDRWWGPRGFTTTTASRDVRPGGEWLYLMQHAEHGEFPNRVRYVEITPPERIVYDHDAGADDTSGGFRTTVTFIERDGKTELTLHSLFASAEACAKARQYGAVAGGEQNLDRFEAHLGIR